MVHNTVHHSGHDKSGGYVKDRVLLDKHGRQNDRRAQKQGACADALMFFQPGAFHHREMTAEGVIYMDAGPEVCRRIRSVEHGDQTREYVVSWHNGGTKIVSVWPERADNQKNGHSGKQKSAYPKIVVLIFKEEIENDHRHIGKPQEIGNDENLAEGDEVIRFQVDQPVVACHVFLQPGKPLHIYDSVENKRQCMSVFIVGFYKCVCHIVGSLFTIYNQL